MNNLPNFRVYNEIDAIIEMVLAQIQIDLNYDNVLFVSKRGSDIAGARSGPPFGTINKAIEMSKPGDTVLVFPGIYEETIELDNINLAGIGDNVFIITEAVEDTTLCTVSDNVKISNINFSLTSLAHVNLIGILMIDSSSQTSYLRNVTVDVDNSSASSTGTSNIIGIKYECNTMASASFIPPYSLNMVDVDVDSSGLGNKIGVWITGTDVFAARYLTSSSTRVLGTGNGYFGLEVNNESFMYIFNSQINGTTGKIQAATFSRLHIGDTLEGTIAYNIVNPVQGLTSLYKNNTNQRCFVTLATFTQFTFAAISGEVHLVTSLSDALIAFMTASTDSGPNTTVPRSQAVYCNSTSTFGFGSVIVNPGDTLKMNIIGNPTGMTGVVSLTIKPDVILTALF